MHFLGRPANLQALSCLCEQLIHCPELPIAPHLCSLQTLKCHRAPKAGEEQKGAMAEKCLTCFRLWVNLSVITSKIPTMGYTKSAAWFRAAIQHTNVTCSEFTRGA